MIESVRKYLAEFVDGFGQGWNQFWFVRRDPCVLGVIRLLTGMVAFYVIFTYGPDLQAFFGENGLLSIEDVKTFQTQNVRMPGTDQWQPREPWRFSYLDYLHTPSSLRGGYVAGLVVLGLFTIGFQSRITSVLSLLVVLSFIQRGPQLTSQVEPVLTMVMFYLCLGPSGASLSIDRWLTGRRAATPEMSLTSSGNFQPSAAATIVTRLIQIHLCVFVAISALSKLVAITWWSGSAAWWLIARPESRLFDMNFMSNHIYLLNAWTHLLVVFELTFPVLVWNKLARPLMLALGLVYLLLLALASGLLTYTLMLAIAGLSFVSPTTMRAVLDSFRKTPATTVATSG